jgi:flagellar basal-body rod protein FlgB
MSFTSLDSLGKTSLMMDLISQRQRALGTNVANVDTPGYVRRDIDFSQYLGSMNSPLETKLSTKLGPSGILEEREKEEIDIAQELSEMQKNSLLYTMATRRMSNIITEMKTVVNVGK